MTAKQGPDDKVESDEGAYTFPVEYTGDGIEGEVCLGDTRKALLFFSACAVALAVSYCATQ